MSYPLKGISSREFTSLDYEVGLVGTVVTVIACLLYLLIMKLLSKKGKDLTSPKPHIIVGISLGLFVSISFIAAGFFIIPNNHSNKAIEGLRETYGITLTKDDIKALAYPEDKPDHYAEIFDTSPITYTLDGETVSKDLTLVSVDGEMRLYEMNKTRTSGEELPRIE